MIGESNVEVLRVVRDCKIAGLACLVATESITYTILPRFAHAYIDKP